jgi:3-hydroxyisobutyrate dehydrogenase-like beta-hydroxyacid dehydrogenase
MGAPMATVMSRKFPTVGFDLARSPGQGGEGVRILADPDAVAEAADVICLSLASPQASIDVTRALARAPRKRVTLIAELSTIGIEPAETCGGIAEQGGLAYVDAPVSGGVARASTGELSIMAAGRPEHIAAARPVLEQISARLFVMGERVGLGQAMKLANNIVAATSLAVTSEAVVFGTRVGLDMAQMIEVMNASTGRTESSEVKFPRNIVTRRYRQGARAAIMHKDVSLYVLDAKRLQVPLRVAAATEGLWGEFARIDPEVDFSRIHKYLEDMLPGETRA